jgi:outer membrane protein assembly factor BamB
MDKEVLPTAQTTLVILLGASQWPRWPDLHASEAFARSARGIKTYFLDRFHLPQANLLDLFDSNESADDIDNTINQFLNTRIKAAHQSNLAIRDILLFYFGHAGFTEGGLDYYLALQRTQQRNPELSALQMASLAKTLRKNTRNLRLMLILDCCYSAAAFEAFQFQGDQLEEVARIQLRAAFRDSRKDSLAPPGYYPRKGIALLCSSSRGSASLLDELYTEFSEALLKCLNTGSADEPGQMSLYTVGNLVQNSLRERGKASKPEIHSPDQREGDIAAVPFFPNPQAQVVPMHQADTTAVEPRQQIRPPMRPSQVSPRPGPHVKLLITFLFLVLLLCAGGGATWFVVVQQQEVTAHYATATAVAFAPLATATAAAATRAYWAGTSRNGVQFGFDAAHTRSNPYERVLNAANVSHVRQLWSFTTGASIVSSPAVANGMVYISSEDGKLYAFDATCSSRCQPLWSFPTRRYIVASPTVANGMVYISSEDGNLYAFDATCSSRCQPLWSFPIGIDNYSQTATNEMLYISSSDGNLLAFNATCRSRCKPLWSFNTGSGLVSSPTVANGMVYVGSDDLFYAFNSTCRSECQPLWSFNTRGPIYSSPAVANGMVYLVHSDNGNLSAFDATCRHSCQPLWSFTTGASIYSSPTVANGVVYIDSSDHKLYAFDATCRHDCQPLWSFTTGGPIDASPTVANGVIYIGSIDGRLYALGLTTSS